MARSASERYAAFRKTRVAYTSDNTPIAYSALPAADPDAGGIPILWANGWTCPDMYWAKIVPALQAAGHPAIVMDNRGHAQSGLPVRPGCAARNILPEHVSVARMGQDMIEVLDDAGIDRAVLVGHSLGVQTIFEGYRHAPDRIAGLVTVAGTYENPVKTFNDLPILDTLFGVFDAMLPYLPLELLSPVIRRYAPGLGVAMMTAVGASRPDITYEELELHLKQIHELNLSVLFRMMSQMHKHSAGDLLPAMPIPVLVCAGENDIFTPPRVQHHIADTVPNGSLRSFPGGTHMLPLDVPTEIAEAIIEWLALSPAGQTVHRGVAGG